MSPAPLQQQLVAALVTVQWLNVNEFTPLNQQAGAFPKPVILIEACGKCQYLRRAFGAEVVGRGSNAQGNFKRWQSEVKGCLVQWIEVTP